jgi:hypothetical protein
MVMSARADAPRDSNGAVEVAAAFVRWLNQYPYPEASDIAEIEANALAASAPTQDMNAFFETEPNLSGGLVPDDMPYYLSTVGGVYHLEEISADRAEVTIGTSLVENGELSPALKGSITVTVVWQNDGWSFDRSEGTRTTEDLFSIGTPFTEGC